MKYKTENEGFRIKEEAQRRLQEEYESRREEFDSFAAFIRAKAEESEFVRQVKEKISGVKRAA